jgi:hypothetical protein
LRIPNRPRGKHCFIHAVSLPRRDDSPQQTRSACGAPRFRAPILRQIRLQTTFRHSLHTRVRVATHPLLRLHLKLHTAVLNRKIVAFTDVAELNRGALEAEATPVGPVATPILGSVAGTHYEEAHRIPRPLFRQPPATQGVAEIAFLQLLRRRNFSFVSRRSAAPAPSASQGEPRWMRPRAVLQFLQGHEERTGHG